MRSMTLTASGSFFGECVRLDEVVEGQGTGRNVILCHFRNNSFGFLDIRGLLRGEFLDAFIV